MPESPSPAPASEARPSPSEYREQRLANLAELQARGIAVKACTESGPVVAVILDVAEREGVDLIAMASHGRTGLGRVFYGSVAEGILHKADRPLLLIRATD